MFGVSFSEVVLILALAIVVLGPDKLPEAGRFLGKTLRQWRTLKNDFTLNLNDATSEKVTKPTQVIKNEKSNLGAA